MKTLAGWIAGIFGLGLFLGSQFGGTAADRSSENTLEGNPVASVLADVPSVDCGPGREAVLQPAVVNGQTSVQVKCIATVPTRQLAAPAHYATYPTYSPEVVRVSTNAPNDTPAPRTVELREETRKGRSAKETALIIGGSAGAGAGIGAIAKGKKGALLGAAIGGVAGTVYDLATRNRK
jgi:hypothetical protein